MGLQLNLKRMLACALIMLSTIHLARFYHVNLVVRFYNETSLSTVLEGNDSWNFPDCEEIFRTKGIYITELELYDTNIDQLDQGELKKLPNLRTLVVENNKRIRSIPSNTFRYNTKLTDIQFRHNSLERIEKGVFSSLFKAEFQVGRLDLSFNNLRKFPLFTEPVPALKTLILDNNPIKIIPSNAFENITHLEKLFIRNTLIRTLESDLFKSNQHLHHATFNNNKQLERIASNAFAGAYNLKTLDLSGTAISNVPYIGLERLTDLTLQNTRNLWQIPDGIVGIPTLKRVHVAKQQRWLCCAFKMKRSIIQPSLQRHGIDKKTISRLCRTVTKPSPPSPSVTTKQPNYNSTTEDPFSGFGRKRRALQGGFGFLETIDDNKTSVSTPSSYRIEDHFTDDDNFIKNTVTHSNSVICNPNVTGTEYNIYTLEPVDCYPGPDALRPCDDIMGNVFLTSISWLFSIIALVGNAMVFSVLVLSRRSVSVTKFLLINLSFADLMLAFYLFILVSASSHTHGHYYNYVREWQYGGGCALAGFLALFSSQLSMLVLIVITVERYFAIVYAMHFHRRVTKNHAIVCMVGAWVFSLLMAFLPLVGVNSYTDVAICLPFKTETTGDVVYIALLLFVNIAFFIFVVLSYIRMFWVVRSPHLDNAPQRSDSEVAKRMGLLVFTDFLCWGPIAFVGLVSAFGGADALGVTVKNSKFLLVIFFPINSLCNPFLYAVSTNSFKRDFYDLLIRCGLCQDCIARKNEGMYTNSLSQKHTATGDTLGNSTGLSVGRNSTLLDRISTNKDQKNRKNKRGKNNEEFKTIQTPTQSVVETPIFDRPRVVVEAETPFLTNSQGQNDSLERNSFNSTRDINQNDEELSKKIHGTDDNTDEAFLRYDLSPEALRRVKQSTNV